MAERYLRVRYTREQATTVYLRVDDEHTQLHELPLRGPGRVAETGRIIEHVRAALEAMPPLWEEQVAGCRVDVISEEEATSCGVVFDATPEAAHG
jgi:hypothetical protein